MRARKLRLPTMPNWANGSIVKDFQDSEGATLGADDEVRQGEVLSLQIHGIGKYDPIFDTFSLCSTPVGAGKESTHSDASTRLGHSLCVHLHSRGATNQLGGSVVW